MANLVVRPYDPADAVALTGCPAVFGAGPAFTACVDGLPAASAGVVLCSWGQWGAAWALLGPLALAHGAFVTRAVVRGLVAIIREHRLIRVEADVLVDDPTARRWVEWLGFAEEGVMARRGPGGATMLRYALFPKVEV